MTKIIFVWNLGDWDLFEIWCLEFGAFKFLCSMPYADYSQRLRRLYDLTSLYDLSAPEEAVPK